MDHGRTWKDVAKIKADRVKNLLIRKGGKEETANLTNELWRIRFCSSVFTYYKNGTFYSTPPDSLNKNLVSVWLAIDSILGPKYVPPTKPLLIGLDETGKGEVIGPTILTGVAFPKELFPVLDSILGPADTKKAHNFAYWDEIFKELIRYQSQGLIYVNHIILPYQIDRYNLNYLLDKGYHKILNTLLKKSHPHPCRITIDDYGVGEELKELLVLLKERGNGVNIVKDADAKYLEVKIAAIISKRFHKKSIEGIKRNPKYQIEGLTIGSGNPNDKETKEWLRRWWMAYRDYPWFVKRSFKTIRRITGI